MFQNLTTNEVLALVAFAVAHMGGLLAAFRAWTHSKAARKLAQDTLDALLIDLREDLADAVAEGASQVIAVVKEHATPAPKVMQ